jgi:DNA-directed RNA polymerase specialized sigma24 family protein
MLVGRTPSLLNNADRRAWVSHRTPHTFEDAVIFVLDMESCLKGLSPLQRELLSRIVLQEFSLAEAATILRVGVRRITIKFESALDALTANLLDADMLVVSS